MRLIIMLVFISANAFSQIPPRKATMGIIPKSVNNGIIIDSLIPNGTFAALKLQKGDIITELNSTRINSIESYVKIASPIRADEKIEVKFIRNQKNLSAKGTAIIRPYELSDIADVQYDWVKFRNGALRAISRKPKGKNNLPCILLIPGYGCGSIENYSANYNGKLLNEWLKAGYAVVTIEKSGMGDSYGCVPCKDADLALDIKVFEKGYQYMEHLPYVDNRNLFIWGHSMGGVIAPEVAKLHHPKGVMVFGTTFRPWSEFLLEMHRVQKPLLENLSFQETETFTRKIQKIYYEFFVLRKTREQLLQNPEYKDLVISELGYKEGNNDMWGRHWKFWPQIDSLNLAKSWQSLSCPVLVLHGASDYESCSIAEPQLIKAAVNAANPGNATMVVVPQLDHFMMKSANYEEARENFNKQQYNKGNFNYSIAEETIRWLNANK